METKRLILRPSVFEDCVRFAEMEGTAGVRKGFTMSKDWDYNKIAPDFVKKSLDDTCEQWTIVLKETGKIIGRVIICDINEHYDSLDITRIYIGEDDLRGKGLGREALEALLAYSFNEKHMERVTLDYVTGNEASDLYRSVGFKDEGNAVHCGKKDGVYVDLHKMAILSGEYYGRE